MKIVSLLIGCFFLLQINPSVVFAQSNLETIKNQIVNDLTLENAGISMCILDLKTNEKVMQYQPKLALSPASTTKLFATASAFEMLGEDFQTETRLYITGSLSKEGEVSGDLYLRGGGDPTLGSKFYNAEGMESNFLKSWADTLFKMGIRKISGSIVGDGSEFGYKGAPDGWTWNDMGNYYGAGPSGLAIYDNMLRYYFKVNGIGSTPILQNTFPQIQNLVFHNYIVGSKQTGDNSYIYGAPYALDRFGTGFLENNTTIMVKGSIPDPELQFALEFRNALIERGIEVTGQAESVRTKTIEPAWKRYEIGHHLLFTQKSPTIASIASWTNLKSVNLFAESLVCLIGFHQNGNGATENGLAQMEKYWESKINTKGLFLKDGSGLSRSNGISAEHFCELLKYMHLSKNGKAFKNTLALAGETGTMHDVCKGQAGHGRVRAKSGTMARIKSYAGYVESKSGNELAFAVIFNNYSGTNSALLQKIEKLMNAMAAR
jgi:D-alanyl-D-alanine carboxypeptidase/D-alanyl-D-alanine-endopeptidase (penicillin-binding protein 4)